ncbi:MAG: pirin family protein [Actinomycetes bacterium]
MTITHVPAAARFHTRIAWLDSWHSFSFGSHFDPTNTHHGLLLVHNDDVIAPGEGFPTHGHADMEIVTWVLEGALEHHDSTGGHGIITPGLAQRMSAGKGVRHSEYNASRGESVRLVQMWVLPDTAGVDPGYEEVDVSSDLADGGLVTVAAGDGTGAVRIHQRGARLRVGRLAPGATVTVADAPHAHVFAAIGSLRVEEGPTLTAGDAARCTGAGSLALTAGADGAEVIVWETA